jgi:hypothetical protein
VTVAVANAGAALTPATSAPDATAARIRQVRPMVVDRFCH